MTHTRQQSSSAGIGESPSNPNTHTGSSSSILDTIRRTNSRIRLRTITSPGLAWTDNRPLSFRFPEPPTRHLHHHHHQPITFTPPADDPQQGSFVASLARAPISSVQRPLTHSNPYPRTFIPQPPTPRLPSSNPNSTTQFTALKPPQNVPGKLSYPTKDQATQPPQMTLTPIQDLASVRLRVMSFETVGGICGKYADPRPRFYGTSALRPPNFIVVSKRPASFDQDDLPDPPRKPNRTLSNPHQQQKSSSLEQVRNKCAVAKAQHSHAQQAWEEMYRSRLEREQWRAEVEASCTTGLFQGSNHNTRSSSHQRRRPRRRPSLVTQRSQDDDHFTPSCAPRLQPSSCLHQDRHLSPNPQISCLLKLNHQPTTSPLNPPPRRRRRAQTTGAPARSTSSPNHDTAPVPSRQMLEDITSPPVGRSFELVFPFLTRNSARHRRTKSNTGTVRNVPRKSSDRPSTAGSEERGYRLMFPHSQDRSNRSRIKALRRSSSVPGIRPRRDPDLVLESSQQQSMLPPLSNHQGSVAPRQSHQYPSFDFTEFTFPKPLPTTVPTQSLEAQAIIESSQSTPFHRAVAAGFNTENFQSFFQHSNSPRSKVVTSQMRDNESFERPTDDYTAASTTPLLKTIATCSPAQQSSQGDSLCDPVFAHLPLSAKARMMSSDSEPRSSARTDSGPSTRSNRSYNRPGRMKRTHSSEDEVPKGPLYSLPLFVPPPRSDSISPLPPPPRSKRNGSNPSSTSAGLRRSRSSGSRKSETTEVDAPLRSSSRGSSRAACVSFVPTSVPAVPALPSSSRSTGRYRSPPHTPTKIKHTVGGTNRDRPEPIIIHDHLKSAVDSLDRIRRLSASSSACSSPTSDRFRFREERGRNEARGLAAIDTDTTPGIPVSSIESGDRRSRSSYDLCLGSPLESFNACPKEMSSTTATNIAKAQPIILHNLPSAVVTLDRIRRLSSPHPLETSSRFRSNTVGDESIGAVHSPSASSSKSHYLHHHHVGRRRHSTANSDDLPPTLEGGCAAKESIDSDRLPPTPELSDSVLHHSSSSRRQNVKSIVDVVCRNSLAERERARGRTVKELSRDSSRSGSEHSVIDLDKYIDQADLFYQVPASPRRDLIKRYSEQMTDERRNNWNNKGGGSMCPARKSRLIDEVLADYLGIEDDSPQIDTSQSVMDSGGGGGESGKSCKKRVSSRKSDLKVPLISKQSSKISLVPSIIDIYEAHHDSQQHQHKQISCSSDHEPVVQ